jgi:hypothetical protein
LIELFLVAWGSRCDRERKVVGIAEVELMQNYAIQFVSDFLQFVLSWDARVPFTNKTNPHDISEVKSPVF